MDATPVPTKRWARAEYERLVDRAVFQPGDRVELVGGQLVVREPQGSPHAVAVRLAKDVIRSAFGSGWEVRGQMPVALDDESEPELDVAVCAGSPRDYLAGHPSRPVLLVEVADASLAFDLEHKGSLYARAQVPDYWIVNLVDHVPEVHATPHPPPRLRTDGNAARCFGSARRTPCRRWPPNAPASPSPNRCRRAGLLRI